MSKLTVEGLVKLLKAIEQKSEERYLNLYLDGSGSLKDSVDGNTIKTWGSLDGMFNSLAEFVLTDDVQSQLAEKFN
mgnify:FL=1